MKNIFDTSVCVRARVRLCEVNNGRHIFFFRLPTRFIVWIVFEIWSTSTSSFISHFSFLYILHILYTFLYCTFLYTFWSSCARHSLAWIVPWKFSFLLPVVETRKKRERESLSHIYFHMFGLFFASRMVCLADSPLRVNDFRFFSRSIYTRVRCECYSRRCRRRRRRHRRYW